MGAIISQIPFSLVFYPVNVSTINETEPVMKQQLAENAERWMEKSHQQ